jgi:GT2 family glycosyltransferase
MPDLTISIINYRTKDLTAKCLDSILKKDWKVKYQIFLVDNNSEDGSVEFFKQKYPKIKLITSKQNLGFAGGHNLVLKQLKTEYVLILNSDTEIFDQVIDKMIEFMDSSSEVGISSCKILNKDQSLQPNAGDLPFGAALINWLFNLESIGVSSPSFHRTEYDYYQTIHPVGWLSGSFMMIRKSVIDKVGFFNERFFMYMEDVEFCYRANKKGFKIFINPLVSIKHLSGASSDDPKYRQWLGESKGLLIFYNQLFGSPGEWGVRILIYITTMLRIIAFSLIGKGGVAINYAKVITNL